MAAAERERASGVGGRVGLTLDRKGVEVFTVSPDALVADAVRILGDHDIGSVIVTRTGIDVAGIVSERDIIRRLAVEGAAGLERPVTDVMTTPVTTCSRDHTTRDLMALMTTHRIRHVPVVEGGRMVGLVSARDVIAAYVEALEVATETLAGYVTGTAY